MVTLTICVFKSGSVYEILVYLYSASQQDNQLGRKPTTVSTTHRTRQSWKPCIVTKSIGIQIYCAWCKYYASKNLLGTVLVADGFFNFFSMGYF